MILVIFQLLIIIVPRFNLNQKIAGRTENNSRKNVKIRVPLKYLSKFWQTLEMPLIYCETNLALTLSARFFHKR